MLILYLVSVLFKVHTPLSFYTYYFILSFCKYTVHCGKHQRCPGTFR